MNRRTAPRLPPLVTIALAVAGACSAAVAQGPYPIKANIEGSNTPTEIGSITTGAAGPGGIKATFKFGDGFGYLDDWYDFDWINVEVGYTLDGVPQTSDPHAGTLPAIDPKSGGQIPAGSQDGKPFYYTEDEWNTNKFGTLPIHHDKLDSIFWDKPSDGSNNSTITFHTYLVARSVTDQGIAPTDLCILGGFSWVFDNTANTATATGGLAANASEVNSALGNADPAFDDDYTAADDCELSSCPLVYDEIHSPPTAMCSMAEWWHDGAPIGFTFKGGVTVSGGSASDFAILPIEANGWHWSITHFFSGSPRTFTATLVHFTPLDAELVKVVWSPLIPQELLLTVDVGSNLYLLQIAGGPVIAQGPWSGYPANLPPQFNFVQTGITRGNRLTCPGDLNGDGVIDGADLGLLLASWGAAGGAADIDQSGSVDGADLGLMLAQWGACH